MEREWRNVQPGSFIWQLHASIRPYINHKSFFINSLSEPENYPMGFRIGLGHSPPPTPTSWPARPRQCSSRVWLGGCRATPPTINFDFFQIFFGIPFQSVGHECGWVGGWGWGWARTIGSPPAGSGGSSSPPVGARAPAGIHPAAKSAPTSSEIRSVQPSDPASDRAGDHMCLLTVLLLACPEQ